MNRYVILPTVLAMFIRQAGAADLLRQEDAHLHGQVQLNVALEGRRAVVEIDAPAMDLLGFEHEPSTEAEHERTALVTAQVARHDSMFEFIDGECGQLSQSLRFSGEEHEHTESEHEQHEDVHLVYEFDCSRLPAGLRFVGFTAFAGIQQAIVQWLDDAVQASATLTPAAPSLLVERN